MKKKCIICGKEYVAKNKSQLCCSFSCKEERMRQVARRYNATHKKEMAEKRAARNARRKANRLTKARTAEQEQKRLKESWIIDVQPNDPEWVKTYKAADRITRITMLARELNNVCGDEPIFTYGKLSQILHTEKYYKLEQDMIKRKRLEHERIIKGDS